MNKKDNQIIAIGSILSGIGGILLILAIVFLKDGIGHILSLTFGLGFVLMSTFLNISRYDKLRNHGKKKDN